MGKLANKVGFRVQGLMSVIGTASRQTSMLEGLGFRVGLGALFIKSTIF